VTVDAEEILTSSLLEAVGRPFRHEAENRQLSFNINLDPNLGRSIVTDSKRLQQVLKNLLSNAFKFTAEGGVRLDVSAAVGGWSAEHPILNHAPAVVAFEVSDTGIGIPLEKQKLIFEAFQQADAGTSRYGGTCPVLAISREFANRSVDPSRTRPAEAVRAVSAVKYSGITKSRRGSRRLAYGTTPVRFGRGAGTVIEQLPDDRLISSRETPFF
jgi:signal transduction histidine kinase